MALWNLGAELIDIIEFIDDSRDTISYRFERHDNEIKNGAKLIVREGQEAIFVNEGKIADIFKPGTYTLSTQNIPILSTLKGWKHGFDSPFKAEVYFVTTRDITDMKWGTQNPFMYPSERFGPIDLRGFGSYAMKVKDSAVFIRKIVGTDGHFTYDKFSEYLRSLVVTRAVDAISESNLPIEKIAVNQNELSEIVREILQTEFLDYGLELTKFLIENISMPDEEKKQIYEYIRMEKINMSAYQQKSAADAMKMAAGNEGGGAASDGIGMGMGFAMAGQMGKMFDQNSPQQSAQNTPSGPPPIPQKVLFHAVIGGAQAGPFDINTLKNMISKNELTKETLIWKDGMANWQPAAQVDETKSLFGSTPPPIPQ